MNGILELKTMKSDWPNLWVKRVQTNFLARRLKLHIAIDKGLNLVLIFSWKHSLNAAASAPYNGSRMVFWPYKIIFLHCCSKNYMSSIFMQFGVQQYKNWGCQTILSFPAAQKEMCSYLRFFFRLLSCAQKCQR